MRSTDYRLLSTVALLHFDNKVTMSLLLSMLPIYLFGNLHCMGMCGPLVMMIGHHRFRFFYFLGRTTAFTLAGLAAGGAGSVLHLLLTRYHIPAATCFGFGSLIFLMGIFTLMKWQYPGYHWLSHRLARVNQSLTILILRDQAWPSFLFGFFTIALPCGQTVIVFSACALSGDLFTGLINGFAFALLTSPALFLAMKARHFFQKAKQHYNTIIGISALIVGTLAILRGFAEIGLISHWVVNPTAPIHYHIVIF